MSDHPERRQSHQFNMFGNPSHRRLEREQPDILARLPVLLTRPTMGDGEVAPWQNRTILILSRLGKI